jgi:Tfp pilus assembly protein PilO
MGATENGERRGGLKANLLQRLHDPLQVRICVVGVALLAGYGAVYLPLRARIDATARKLSEDQKLAALVDSAEQLRAQCGSFAKRLPPQADSKEWMQYVHEGVRQFPLKLCKLESSDPKSVGPCKAVVLQVEVEGPFADLDGFLRWLESNPRLFRADEISIGPAKAKQQNGTMLMKLTVLGLAG